MRILLYAFRNIIRNPFLSISSIFVITLLVFFVNVLLLVLFASERFIAGVNDRISFTINFQSGYSLEDLDAKLFVDDLRTSFSGVTIETISKTQAFALLQSRNPDLASLIENTGENPLPDSLRINDIPLDRYDAVDAMISTKKNMLRYDQDAMNQKLLDYKSQFSRISLVVKLLSLLQYSVYALLGLFLFTVAVIIYTVIGNSIFFHKEEIEIISLVGGQSGFIYGPFLLQGVFYSLSATLLVSGILLFIRSLISIEFVSGPLMSIQQKVFTELPSIILIELGVFSIIALISSGIAIRKYLRG